MDKNDQLVIRKVPRNLPTMRLDRVAHPWVGRLVYVIDRDSFATGPWIVVDEGTVFVDPLDSEVSITELRVVSESDYWRQKFLGAPADTSRTVAAHHVVTLAV